MISVALLMALAATSNAAFDSDQSVQSKNGEFIFSKYPPKALAAGEQGAVGFRADVNEKGIVLDCEVIQSSGHWRLDRETCELIVRHATFRPVLDSEGKALWTIEATRYKSAVTHRIPLSALAVSELKRMGRRSPLVFPSHRKASAKPFSGFGKLLLRLQTASETEGWTLHDLRRTLRTGLAALRVREEIADACLGHEAGDEDRGVRQVQLPGHVVVGDRPDAAEAPTLGVEQ